MTQQPSVYELLGRKEEELAKRQATIDACMGIFRALKQGRLSLDDLEMTSDGFKVQAGEIQASEPVKVDDVVSPQTDGVRE